MTDLAPVPTDLVTRLRTAKRVAALTGAGISAESGIPTFRDAQTGLWARYRPEELASPEGFRANPRLVWEWYAWRRELVTRAKPNPGHLTLAEMERRVARFTLITQNVDGFHHEAGSRAVLELHGNIRRTTCFSESIPVDRWEETGAVPPRCPRCGGPLRPDVVWFGEPLPREALEAALDAAGAADVFLSVGTSTVVEPAASLPFLALRAGATVVEVNPGETPLSASVPYSLRGAAGEILPAVVAAAWPAAAG